nr:reverse transcriptase domain-containing protein [Tanacetum cinerariifolium]
EDPKEDHANGGDDDDDEEEEGNLALAESTTLHVVDPIPLAEDTEVFETDESAPTPPIPSPRLRRARISIRPQTPMLAAIEALIVAVVVALPSSSPPPSPLTLLPSPLPQIPSPPLLLPSPPTHTSLTYAEAPLGYKVAMIWSSAASPLPLPAPSSPFLLLNTDHREDVLEDDVLPQKRLCLTALAPSFVDTVDATPRCPMSREDTHEIYVQFEDARVNTLFRDRRYRFHTAMFLESEARYTRHAWSQAIDCNRAGYDRTRELEPARDLEPQDGPVDDGVADALAEYEAHRSSGNGDDTHESRSGRRIDLTQWFEKMESVFHISNCTVACQINFATCTLLGNALTWWNSHVKIVGHDAAYGTPWKTFKKIMTDKYSPRGEIKKLEIELWNLKVKCTDVLSYNQHFKELARMCSRMFPEKSDEVENSIIDIIPTALNHDYDVELADGKIIRVNTIIRGCTLNLLNHLFNIDLMPVELGSFDVIIGMDWLVKYHTVIVCDEKIVRIPFGNEILTVRGDRSNNGHESRLNIISCTKTQKYLLKGCDVFLAHFTTKKAEDKSEEKRLKNVPIVQDFPKVFLEDLPGISPTRQVEFQIDLVPGAAPVARGPYQLTSFEMKELLDQL